MKICSAGRALLFDGFTHGLLGAVSMALKTINTDRRIAVTTGAKMFFTIGVARVLAPRIGRNVAIDTVF